MRTSTPNDPGFLSAFGRRSLHLIHSLISHLPARQQLQRQRSAQTRGQGQWTRTGGGWGCGSCCGALKIGLALIRVEPKSVVRYANQIAEAIVRHREARRVHRFEIVNWLLHFLLLGYGRHRRPLVLLMDSIFASYWCQCQQEKINKFYSSKPNSAWNHANIHSDSTKRQRSQSE